jgi:hypothetical protein
MTSLSSTTEKICLACEYAFSTPFQENVAGVTFFLNLISNMMEIYCLFSHYKCQEVIPLVSELPECQSNSGWVIILLAKSYIELHNFREVSPYDDLD